MKKFLTILFMPILLALLAFIWLMYPDKSNTVPLLINPDYDPCELSRIDRKTTSSLFCISCHDGIISTAPEYNNPADEDTVNGAHKIEVDYEMTRLKTPEQYTPTALLPPNIVLVNGMVACTSCHDGKSTYSGKTAMNMKGSAMCLACHIK